MRTRTTIGLTACVLAVVGALVLALLGRGVNPANLIPRVAASTSSGSTLYVDFTTAVNLPVGARVLSRGAQIGTLSSIDLVPGAARLTLTIDNGVALPRGTRADLRQSSILGDVYVALTPPTTGRTGAMLGNRDTIPLSDTDPGPQVEDIIVNLADFMSGGSLNRTQDALRQVNRSLAVPGLDLGKASALGARDVQELAASTDQLDGLIASLQRSTGDVASRPGELAYAVSGQGRFALTAVFSAVAGGFELVAGARDLSVGLNWVTPRLLQLNPFLDRLVPLLRTYSASARQLNGNAGKLVDLYQNSLLPFARDGLPVSLDKLTVNGKTDVTGPATSVLRMIGAVR